MSVAHFGICFDNLHATYFAGQHVTGKVVIELLKEKKIRAVDLKFFGEAKVQWSETSGDSTTYYSNNDVYLKNSVTLEGGTSSDISLPPGTHSYPFRLILPLDLPSSFESKHGYVRYTAKAAIRRSGRFDHHCKSAFTVICPLDLNNEPDVQEPVQKKEEKRLFFGLGGSPIRLEVSLPYSGYVPGQKCEADFEFENRTTNNVSLKAYIVQIIKLKAKGYGEKIERNSICKKPIGEFSSQNSMKSGVGLQIPVVPNSYLRYCKFIDISYMFEETIYCIVGCLAMLVVGVLILMIWLKEKDAPLFPAFLAAFCSSVIFVLDTIFRFKREDEMIETSEQQK
ncbi:Uncharacterized protein GBIM_01384 [Gryllus bimaculatus]|nr:Uncharacterized protein GBIM_01384 [Gryllus bimaculatus]